MEYIDKGICIFCGKNNTETTFKEKPHTTPKSLGSDSIGVDICDICNHYFGEIDKLLKPPLTIEICVKEILGLIKFLLNNERGVINNSLRSIYFEFWKSEKTLKIKGAFKYNYNFTNTFTTQFKRGVYEMFLQEYHKETRNALDSKFDEIRQFARYNKGDVPLYILRGDNGILLLESEISTPRFHFNEMQIKNIDNNGFYNLIIWGQWFYLEVTPKAKSYRDIYLNKEAEKMIGSEFIFNNLIEIKSIYDIDFTLNNLFRRTKVQ